MAVQIKNKNPADKAPGPSRAEREEELRKLEPMRLNGLFNTTFNVGDASRITQKKKIIALLDHEFGPINPRLRTAPPVSRGTPPPVQVTPDDPDEGISV